MAVAGVSLVIGAFGGAGCGGGGVTTASPTATPATPATSVPSSAPSAPATTSSPSPTATGLPASLTGRVLYRISTTARVVALTFDGGSGAQGAPSVLSTLHMAGVPATFFLTGQFVQRYPQTAAQMAATGLIGNHTMTHPHLTQLSSAAVRSEVENAESAIGASTNGVARPWLRFPYGEYDARTLAIVNGLGYAAIGWTVDTRGWMGTAGAGTVDDIVSRALAQLQPGAIVLMHLGAAEDATTLDADALPKLIAAIRGAGYSFVTINAFR